MPHECTNCGLTFPDGSKEMLSGCPDCGGNKFQFRPGGASPDKSDPPSSTDSDTAGGHPDHSLFPEAPPGESRPESTPSKSTDSSFTIGSLRSEDDNPDPSSGGSKTPPDGEESPETSDPAGDDDPPNPEDSAQASARRTVPSGDEIPQSGPGRTPHPDPSDPDTSQSPPDEHPVAPVKDSDDSDPPNISELREELNEQFESIKIHAPGEYELNLMELYDREEHIIALQEDGRYVIDVPSSWRETDEVD
jgi:predicted  nucleic acid-binding Zn-ribbon protein